MLCVYFLICYCRILFTCKYDVYSDFVVNRDAPRALLKDVQVFYSVYKALAVAIMYVACLGIRRYVTVVMEHAAAAFPLAVQGGVY